MEYLIAFLKLRYHYSHLLLPILVLKMVRIIEILLSHGGINLRLLIRNWDLIILFNWICTTLNNVLITIYTISIAIILLDGLIYFYQCVIKDWNKILHHTLHLFLRIKVVWYLVIILIFAIIYLYWLNVILLYLRNSIVISILLFLLILLLILLILHLLTYL